MALYYLSWPNQHIAPWMGVWPEAIGHRDNANPCVDANPYFNCIHLLTKGRIIFRFGETLHATLSAGQVFVNFSGVPFSFVPARGFHGTDIQVYWVRLIGPKAPAFLHAAGFSLEKPHFEAANASAFRRIIMRICELSQTYPPDADARALGLIHQLAATCDFRNQTSPERERLAHRVRRYMESPTGMQMNISELSRAFHVSRWSLFLAFKREYGRSPVEIITEIRISHSKKLLTESELPVTDVALRSGYTDISYFSRVFRKTLGMSPSRFRRASECRKAAY